MISDRSCPKCGSHDIEYKYILNDNLHGLGNYDVSECRNCEMQFQANKNFDLKSIYPKDFAQHNNIPPEPPKHDLIVKTLKYIKDISWGNNIGLVTKPIKNGRILELGCGNGYGLVALKASGWENIHGIELIDSAAQKARNMGFFVASGSIEDMLPQYPDDYFDIIVAHVVMEHLVNPFEVSKLVAKKLKPGGKFLFSTTQKSSIDSLVYKEYWAGFDMRHMVFFRKKDLIDMLKDDFEDIKIYHQPISVDFYRPSEARIKDGKGNRLERWFDKFVISLGWNTWNVCLLPLAMLGMTSRVSVHCKKK